MHNPTIPQDIADKALPCNGRELVAAILDHPQGGVGALLSFVGNQETEWLEFKAALYPPEGNFDRGENEDDLQWNIAEAVIALANTLGGAVVLGVDDKSGQSVGLMCSDPKGILESQGREAFNREIILEGTLFKKAGWKTGKKGNIRMEQLQRVKQLVEIRDIEYQGHPLAILLVYPVKDSPIEVSIERSNIPRSATFMRQPGNVGQVVEIQGFSNVGVAFERRNRELNSDKFTNKFTNIWQKFLASLPSIDQQQRMVALEKSLMAYCQQVQQSFGKLQSWFTPLDADERLAEENRLTFEPEAEESLDLYPVDEPWDSWDEEFSDDTEEDEDEEDENDNELEDESDLKLPMPSRLARRGGVFELLEQEPRTILLGEPGAGKTTCLKWLAWEAAVKYQSSAVLILFVPLNQYTSNGLRNLLLKYATVNKSAESHGIEWRDLESLIIQNRLRILLDAFNECPLHLRTQCCQDIYGLLVDYPNILLVVSSRASAYPSQLCLPTFTVRPLDRDQQQRFLAAYLLGDENKAAAILSHLYRQPGGDLIASTPILLRIVREVSKKQGELPHGRALLYRQFFEDWYVREQKKENHTGASLPWSLQKTREALACLAFATRREGQVSCELNRALQRLTPLLHEHARAFLERMAQGLLLTLDEEDQNLAFEHETFQEYFAAEYLIQYPDVLQNLKTEEHASWLMPLAYTFELETQPDIAFIQAAWKLEPLLVAVALRDEAHLRALTIDDGWDPWIRAILRIIRQEEVIPETELIIRKNHAVKLFIPLPDQVKNIFSSKVFWYAGLTYESGKEKLIFLREYFFENSEIWIELIVHACKSNSDWITKLTDIESYQQDRLINNLAYLLKTRAIVRDDIPLEARKNLIKKVNIEKIPNLLRGNLISTDDVSSEIRQALIQNSSRKELLGLIKAKFIFASDVSSEIRQTLIENSSGKELLELIKAKFIFASDVSSEIRQTLIENSSGKELLELSKAKFIFASAVSSEIRLALIQNSSKKELLRLIKAIVASGLASEIRQALIQNSSGKELLQLIEAKAIVASDISSKIRQTLIQSSSGKELLELIEAKVIVASDISSKIRQTLIQNSSGKELLELIKAKFIFASQVSSEIRQSLIQSSSGKELLELIEAKVIVASDISSEIRQTLIQNSSRKELLELIEAKVIVASDISSEIRQALIQNSSGKELLELIEAKAIVASDISSEIRQTLIQSSSGKELLELIEAKVIVASDISSEIRQALIQSSSGKELLELIEAKVIVASDISSEIRQALIQSSSGKELLELIEAKVIVASDINPDAIKAMIKTIPYQELKQFIFLGFITRNDFNKRSYKHFIDNLLDPNDLTKFVLIGFIRREDLDIEKRRKIIEKIYLYEDFLGLAKIKFLQRSDLSNANAKMLADKIKNVNELSFFVVNGVLSKYDLSEDKIQSLMKASQIHTLKELQKKLPNDFEKLIKSGVINKNLLREKKSKSIENVTKKPALPTVKTPNKASCFTMNYTELTIYIDEAWPGNILNAKRPQHEGVIAGIVCPGNPETRLRKLTTIKTHTYQNSIPLIQQSLQNLLNCEKCLPFIFPFTLTDSSDQAIRHYDTLLQHAIKLLLGWVLTPSESSGNVRLHLVFELISGHKSGDEHLDFIKGLLAAHPDRYGRWIIGTARWEEKNFGYIPYADLIAHLTLEHTDVNRMLGKSFDYKNWPGYIPFSLDLVPRLERLEHLESVHNVDDLLDFAAENGTSKFGRLVLTDLARRLANKPKLQERLLDALEQRYQDKVRDLGQLRRLFQTVRRLLPPLPTTTPPRLQLLDHLITLQDANHDGNPDRILAAVQRYSTDRNRLKQDQRELCAYTDLNLAVHYADRFEFGRAEATIGEWVHDPLFPALSTQQRGRLYSALGQYRALQNDPLDAAQWFDKALQCFEQLPEGSDRVGEIDQTSVYRAFNALDARFSNAGMLVETVTGPLEQAANRYSTEDSVADQYRHHLLLRYLHDGGDTVKAARTAYLAQLTNWQDGWPQHPWPLIHLYRGLLLWPDHAGDSGKWFDSALELVTLPQHGITLRLIGAMIATTAACCHATPGYKATARQFLAEIGPQLPAAQSILATLEDILWQPAPEKINEALTTLPFNYR